MTMTIDSVQTDSSDDSMPAIATAARRGVTRATPLASTSQSACPSWCTGGHAEGAEGWNQHRMAFCPPFCTGHVASDDEQESWGLGGMHGGDIYEMTLSTGESCDARILVQAWKMPGCPAPIVAINDDKDEWLDMTPAEAMALAAHLVRAAGIAAPEAPAYTGTEQPSWCAYDRCCPDGLHMSASREVPVAEHGLCSADAPPGEEGNRVWVMAGETGASPVICIAHGDLELPEMTLAAAEEFALNILELISIARTPAHQESLRKEGLSA